jgi:hypothetical protein
LWNKEITSTLRLQRTISTNLNHDTKSEYDTKRLKFITYHRLANKTPQNILASSTPRLRLHDHITCNLSGGKQKSQQHFKPTLDAMNLTQEIVLAVFLSLGGVMIIGTGSWIIFDNRRQRMRDAEASKGLVA